MDYELMRGSENKLDYLVVAKKGAIGLGVKLMGVADARKSDLPRGMLTQFRVRAALAVPENGDMDPIEALKLLSEQAPTNDNPGTYWPKVDWEKVLDYPNGGAYASTRVGTLTKLPDADIDAMRALRDNFTAEAAINGIFEYLRDTIGQEHMIVGKEDLAKFFSEQIVAQSTHLLTNLVAALEQTDPKTHEVLYGSAFTTMSSLLAKKAAQHGVTDDVPDVADEDDEDEF